MKMEVKLIHKSLDWASKVEIVEFTIVGDYTVEFFGEVKTVKRFSGELFTRINFGYPGEILFTDSESNDIGDPELVGILEEIFQRYIIGVNV